MSSVSKSNKQFIIWLENLDTYVQEGSSKPSLFSSEREAQRCAKELWPKVPWRIEKVTYIKKAEKRWAVEEKNAEEERTSMVSPGGFCFHFVPPVSTRKFCVFLSEKRGERIKPSYSAKTLEAARVWANKAAKKFLSIDHPRREIRILNSADPSNNTWEDTITLPEETLIKSQTSKRAVKVIADNISADGKRQPVPHQNEEGRWVCPITGKTYEAGKSVSKRIFTNIIKSVSKNPDKYLPVDQWKAFSYGKGWVCPYTGKIFSRAGKRLDDHITKERKSIKEKIK